MQQAIQDIIENFEFLDDWEDRYKYVIELGDGLEALTEDEKSEQYKVNGCVSQVWVVPEVREEDGDKRLYLRGDSDAHIVRGLVAITIAMFSGLPVREAAQFDTETVFKDIGLRDHITPQRSNGLTSMISTIKKTAQAAA